MNDVAKGEAGARSRISENGGVVAIIAAIFVAGSALATMVYQCLSRNMPLESFDFRSMRASGALTGGHRGQRVGAKPARYWPMRPSFVIPAKEDVKIS